MLRQAVSDAAIVWFRPSPQLVGESWLVLLDIQRDPDQGPT